MKHDEQSIPDGVQQQRARALSSPLRLRILRLCAYQSLTNKELAEALGINPGTMLHHIRTLVAAEMLRADEPRVGKRGAKEVPYRATGLSWKTQVPGMSLTLIDTFLEQIQGISEEDIGITWLGLKLNAEHREELARRINDLVEDFKQREPDPDGELIGTFFAVHREQGNQTARQESANSALTQAELPPVSSLASD